MNEVRFLQIQVSVKKADKIGRTGLPDIFLSFWPKFL